MVPPAPARDRLPREVLDAARGCERVTVLTGAGMSAESGVSTFREEHTGLWARFDPMRLATPEAWFADKPLVWAWNAWRMQQVRAAGPNAGHLALARWQQACPGVRIATQNIDDLHERAGSTGVAHVHGQLLSYRCDTCGRPYPGPVELPAHVPERLAPPPCPHCRGDIRPDVVWFGEMLPAGAFRDAERWSRDAELVLVVGTSGIVYPFAALPEIAASSGATVIEINPDPSRLTETGVADVSWPQTAAVALPALVDAVLA